MEIPINSLSKEALFNIVRDFICREEFDYDPEELSPEQKTEILLKKLKSREAIIVFDQQTETTNIISA